MNKASRCKNCGRFIRHTDNTKFCNAVCHIDFMDKYTIKIFNRGFINKFKQKTDALWEKAKLAGGV